MREIKIIWDFKGPVSEQTAKHHAIHLREFAQLNNIPFLEIDFAVLVKDIQAIAFIAVTEDYMPIIRDRLKPHRAELYEKKRG